MNTKLFNVTSYDVLQDVRCEDESSASNGITRSSSNALNNIKSKSRKIRETKKYQRCFLNFFRATFCCAYTYTVTLCDKNDKRANKQQAGKRVESGAAGCQN